MILTKIYDRLFPMPTQHELALAELQDAQRELLKAESQQEYATAMVQYNSDRVARLKQLLQHAG